MLLIKNGDVFVNGTFQKVDILVDGTNIIDMGQNLSAQAETFDASSCAIFPGFQDAHVHLREPGFSYKETIKDGTYSLAKGGYTSVCAMPNLNPVPDSKEHLQEQLDIIEKDACIEVRPLGSVTVGELGKELSDMEQMANSVIGFSDDGRGVQDQNLLEKAFVKAKALNKPMMLHLEDNELVNKGYVADTPYLLEQGYRGICAASEYKPIEEAIEIAKKTGGHLHICHISSKESVKRIRQAKKENLPVTCEVTTHHLLFEDTNITSDNGMWKMNPPLRSHEDRMALIEAFNDGTIDLMATDNAPHSLQEKSRGLEKSAFGIISSEYSFGLLYTDLVRNNLVTLETLIDRMTMAKAVLKGEEKPTIAVGKEASLCMIDLNKKIKIEKFSGIAQNAPFIGKEIYGEVIATLYKGKMVYRKEGK